VTLDIVCKTTKGLSLCFKNTSVVLLNKNKNRPQEKNRDHPRHHLEGPAQQKRANADYCNCSWHLGHGRYLKLEEEL